jgi:hypothetical protein
MYGICASLRQAGQADKHKLRKLPFFKGLIKTLKFSQGPYKGIFCRLYNQALCCHLDIPANSRKWERYNKES